MPVLFRQLSLYGFKRAKIPCVFKMFCIKTKHLLKQALNMGENGVNEKMVPRLFCIFRAENGRTDKKTKKYCNLL